MNDRRVDKTRAALRDAILTLLPRCGWDELTVQTLCEQANIGRSTFYLHFKSKDELLAETFNDLRHVLNVRATDETHSQQAFPFIQGLLEHMTDNQMVFRSVVGQRSGHIIEHRFRGMVVQLFKDDLERYNGDIQLKHMLAVSMAGSLVDLMAWWVHANNVQPISAVMQFIQQMGSSMLLDNHISLKGSSYDR